MKRVLVLVIKWSGYRNGMYANKLKLNYTVVRAFVTRRYRAMSVNIDPDVRHLVNLEVIQIHRHTLHHSPQSF